MQPFLSSLSLGKCGLPKLLHGMFGSSHIAVLSLGSPFPILQRAPRCHNSFLWDTKGIKLDKSGIRDGSV